MLSCVGVYLRAPSKLHTTHKANAPDTQTHTNNKHTISETIAMAEAVRAQVGLDRPLPFAPLNPQRVVIASRSPTLRQG